VDLSSTAAIPALLVSAAAYLKEDDRPGGVQLCTQEYLRTLRAAGFKLRLVPYDADRRPWARLRRFLRPRPYQGILPTGLVERVAGQIGADCRYVFLNQVDLGPLAGRLSLLLPPGCRIVLLSHGLESVDYLHVLRSRGQKAPFEGLTGLDLKTLARKLVAETQHRLHIAHVFCLSSNEAEIERWLGAPRVDWLPRTIPACPLDWRPVGGRLGYVGTLNHPPNKEGLVLLLRALESSRAPGQRVRLVGGPPEVAKELSRSFTFVDYLGTLRDAELRLEASTWTCFLHPLFCYARGCSTKLAVALGWQVPVVTTPAGTRGYCWREGVLPMADTPEGMARLVARLEDPEVARDVKQAVEAVARSSPTLKEVAAKVRSALLTPEMRNDACACC
jgi:glycosyltransferase involved in cell wall biosynthesis